MEQGKRFYRDGLPYVGRYVDLMFDKGFKRIFGKESNKDLLINLLNEILPELKIRD
ncbi:MAG: PD-(D/E)XK nuclease family transposase, partial [Bacteroidales bacterium]|nr:PD-(D/E)XK nuclease family transposase [Candidatus Cacconaster scatequi]